MRIVWPREFQSLEGGKRLWSGVERISFGQDQQPADAAAVYKHQPEVGRAFGLPALLGDAVDGGGHGRAQVGAGFQALAFDYFPLKFEDD
jgi:hypothetical protein